MGGDHICLLIFLLFLVFYIFVEMLRIVRCLFSVYKDAVGVHKITGIARNHVMQVSKENLPDTGTHHFLLVEQDVAYFYHLSSKNVSLFIQNRIVTIP